MVYEKGDWIYYWICGFSILALLGLSGTSAFGAFYLFNLFSLPPLWLSIFFSIIYGISIFYILVKYFFFTNPDNNSESLKGENKENVAEDRKADK